MTLVGGSTTGRGNVYARNPTTGIYGPVCDDFWNLNAVSTLNICLSIEYFTKFNVTTKNSFQANVVCRQLGFPLGALSYQCCSAYGTVPSSFSYDDVKCTGTETTLNACPHSNVHNCFANEGAGVICKTV